MIRELTIDTLTNELVTCARIKGHRCTLFCGHYKSFVDACTSVKYMKDRGSLIGVSSFTTHLLVDTCESNASLVFNNGSELVFQVYSDDDFRREFKSGYNILYESILKCRVAAITSVMDDGVGMIVDDKEIIEFLSSFKINK